MMSSCRSVTRTMPQGSILDAVVCNIFNDLDNGAECTLSKFSGDTKLDVVTDISHGCPNIERRQAEEMAREEHHEVQ